MLADSVDADVAEVVPRSGQQQQHGWQIHGLLRVTGVKPSLSHTRLVTRVDKLGARGGRTVVEHSTIIEYLALCCGVIERCDDSVLWSRERGWCRSFGGTLIFGPS